MRRWRLVPGRRAASVFDGEGARRWGGRWNPPGHAVVYGSATLSLALLEVLVHADWDLLPAEMVAFPIEVPAEVRTLRIAVDALPTTWRQSPPPAELAELGRRWLETGDSAVLEVPSAVVPQESNVLLDPRHPDFRRLLIGPAEPFLVDPRLG